MVPELKYLQQYVKVSVAVRQPVLTDKRQTLLVRIERNSNKASVMLSIMNRYCFIDLSHLGWSWSIICNRFAEPIGSNRFEVSSNSKEVDVMVLLDSVVSEVRKLEHSKYMGIENTYYINIRGFLRKDTSWAQAGHDLVIEQFVVKFEFEETFSVENIQERITKPVFSLESVTDEYSGCIRVFRVSTSGEKFPLVEIDRISGALVSYCTDGNDLLSEGIVPNFVRAATDNDKGGADLVIDFFNLPQNGFVSGLRNLLIHPASLSYYSHWKSVGLTPTSPPDFVCLRIRITDGSNSERIGIVALCRVMSTADETELFKVKLHYTIYSNGKVRISSHVTSLNYLQAPMKNVPSLARVGMSMQVDPSLSNIQYFGKGPYENYPDRNTASEMGVYNMMEEDLTSNTYIYPVENGLRTGCEWVSFRTKDDSGFGMVTTSTSIEEEISPFSFSALLNSSAELEAAKHTHDMSPRTLGVDPIHVNIDICHMGLGGDNR